MLRLNVAHFSTALKKTNPFVFPEMNDGTKYLYDNLYGRLLRGENVMLSDLDYNAFDSEDITSLCNLHNDHEKKYNQANSIADILRHISPISKDSVYI